MNPSLANPNYNLQVQGFQPPTVPTTMDASSIQTPTNVSLTPATPALPVPNIQNIPTDTATPSQTNTTTQTTPANPLDQTSSAWKQAFDKVTGLFSSKQNQASDLASATSNATAPYEQQLNEINTQIKMQQANAIANQEKAANAGETSGYASREQQNIARTDAIETLKLSAIQAGLQGNIALAEKQATNAINAKYADINKQIEDAKTNIYNNYDSFSASEKKKADQTLLRLDAQDAFAKKNQEDEKASAGIIQTAILQGKTNGNPVPTLVLTQASKLTDPTQVTQLLAPYLVDAAGIQAKIDAHNASVANTKKINSEANTVSNTSSTLDASGNTVTNPVVASWVANINSGKAKLSDITAADLKKYPNLKNDISVALSQSGGAASTILDTTKQSIQELNDMVNNNRGFTAAVGANVPNPLGIFTDPLDQLGFKGLPGTQSSAFISKLNQVINEQVLPNLSVLKGLGRVTQTEFNTLQTALTSLNKNLPEADFKKELKNITDRINAIPTTDTTSNSGTVSVISPDGTSGTIPKDQLQAALKAGYKQQ